MEEADKLFCLLDSQLESEVDAKFFIDPKIYRSLIDVVAIVNTSMGNRVSADSADLISALKQNNDLLKQIYCVLSVIERVVKFQHGGLNNSVDTMGEVLRSYNSNREEVQTLRSSLLEARNVLTQKKQGHIALKELWLQKIEAEESLRILDALEKLKDAPGQVLRFMQQRRYVNAVCALNTAIDNMFNDDLVAITAIDAIRQQLMELKGTIVEAIVGEVKNIILGTSEESMPSSSNDMKDVLLPINSAEELDNVDNKSESSFRVSSSARSNKLATPSDPLDEWSCDLTKITEEYERSVLTPAGSKPLFARLLVKAVGLLHCEDDVDRFLLEEGAIQFQLIIKSLREQVSSILDPNTSNVPAKASKPAGVSSGILQAISFENEPIKNFTIYASALLDKGIAVLRRLLHVLRLLNISKFQLNQETIVGKEVDLSLKRGTGVSVLNIWSEVERAIYTEFQTHFTEQSVEQISDKSLPTRDRISMLSKRSISRKKGDSHDDEDDDSPGSVFLEELPPLFPPSAHLAAPVYREVVVFSEQSYALLSADISFELLVEADHDGNSVRICNSILDFMKRFLEDELMPVVQGAVNREMRDIQMNADMFSVPPVSATTSYTSTRSEVPVCKAGRKVFEALSPLFSLYVDLPQHRDASLTILDRAVRGFASIAREEMEAITFRWRSAQPAILKAILAGMTADPLFVAYRKLAYDGKESVEDLATPAGSKISNSQVNIAARRGSRIFTASSIQSLLQAVESGKEGEVNSSSNGVLTGDGSRGNAREADCWGRAVAHRRVRVECGLRGGQVCGGPGRHSAGRLHRPRLRLDGGSTLPV